MIVPGVKAFDTFRHWKNEIDERDFEVKWLPSKTAVYSTYNATGVNLISLFSPGFFEDVGFVTHIYTCMSTTQANWFRIDGEVCAVFPASPIQEIPVYRPYPFAMYMYNASGSTQYYSFGFRYLPKRKYQYLEEFGNDTSSNPSSLENKLGV